MKGVRVLCELPLQDEALRIVWDEAAGEFLLALGGTAVAAGSKAFRLSNYAFANGAASVRHDYDGSRRDN